MSDLERELTEQFAREAAAVPEVPRGLWVRMVEGAGPPPSRWLRLAPLAVALLFVAAAGLAVANSRRSIAGPARVVAGATVSPRAAGPDRSPGPSASPGTSAAFSCGASPSGGGGPAGLTAVRLAHQDGYDRITFEFSGGVPAYTVSQQAGAHFTQDASGKAIDLPGVQGLKVVFRNASGQSTYSGPTDLSLAPEGSPDRGAVAELRQLGDFERVLSWGAGLKNRPACLRVSQLVAPARLVLDVQARPAS
jgi:hypothetical protein